MTIDDLARRLGITVTRSQLEALFANKGNSAFLEIDTSDDEYVFELFGLDELIGSDEIDAIGHGLAIARDAGDWLLCLHPGQNLTAFILNPSTGAKVAEFGSLVELASKSKWL